MGHATRPLYGSPMSEKDRYRDRSRRTRNRKRQIDSRKSRRKGDRRGRSTSDRRRRRSGGRRVSSRGRGRRRQESSRRSGGRGDRRRGARDDSRRKTRTRRDRKKGKGRSRSRSRRQNGYKKRRAPSPSTQYSSGSDDRSRSSSDSNSKGSNDGKDEIVHFDWRKGAILNSRYEVQKLLGDGTFGRVLLAADRSDGGKKVAIKVIRDIKRYIENAKIEADILKDIRKADPEGERTRSAVMTEQFPYQRHYCLVFPALGQSLYDFMKGNEYRGFLLQDLKDFAKQSLDGLAFLHDKMKLTHTDLKPENILLECSAAPRPWDFPAERQKLWLEQQRKSSKQKDTPGYLRPASSQIRLIDFGNATYADEHHSSIINTRQYRGPEVVLQLGWDERSDIWSMGCIFMELYSGELLFGTHENIEHLALMEKTLEPLPHRLLDKVEKGEKKKYATFSHHSNEWRLNWPAGSSSNSSERHVKSQKKLKEMMATSQHNIFAEFVSGLLTMDPSRRPSAQQALTHKFFDQSFTD
eukprot:TRINITY_DN50102_c0_g1_i1.p1 TRINITY_DN50102_c0_g1~~TRINITY_DN50102_c0_g1_i1.p1  ORF type:complete len:524 (-),score=89.61 TRINITY_DN50102_c0_g1_i1:622-2193(-)